MLKALSRIMQLGSGKRVSLDALLPFAIVPLFSIIGAVSLYLTIAVFTTVGALLIYLRCALQKIVPRTQFFFMWLSASILFLLLIFHTIVITKLEILLEEHIALLVLTVLSLFLMHNVRKKAKTTYRPYYISIEDGQESLSPKELKTEDSSYCQICVGEVRGKMFHSLWLDCCITTTSYSSFVIGNLIGVCGLFYGANLILTSICHPYIAFGNILLPENCENVYNYFDFATCFVCGVYAIIIGILLVLFLLQQLFFNVKSAILKV